MPELVFSLMHSLLEAAYLLEKVLMYQFAQCIDSVISSSGIFGVQRRDFIYVILYRILDLVALVSEPLETLCQPILSCSVPDLV